MDGVEHLLPFAPVELALEVAAIHELLDPPTTWGDARAALSAERFAELVEWTHDAGDPADDQAVELSRPGFGSMLDSGTNFLRDDQELIVDALERAGVTVRTDGPDLEDLFELM